MVEGVPNSPTGDPIEDTIEDTKRSFYETSEPQVEVITAEEVDGIDEPETGAEIEVYEVYEGIPRREELPALVPMPSPPPFNRHPAHVYLRSLSEGSRRTMRGALKTIAKALIGDKGHPVTFPWHELRYEHTTFVRAYLAHEYKPATANRMLSALKGILKECWRLDYMTAEDLARATDIKTVRGQSLLRGRRLPANELRELFELLAEDEKPVRGARDAALIALLYVCGLRRAEAAALDVEDVDRASGEVRVLYGKGNKERITYADGGALAAVEGWLGHRGDHAGPLFNPVLKNGRVEVRRINSQTVYDVLRRRGKALQKRLGAKSFSPHDFRRTFISDLIAESKDLPSAQGLAGHASIETTARYDRRGEIARKQAAARLQTPYQTPERAPDPGPDPAS